jgi:hypothetical protein
MTALEISARPTTHALTFLWRPAVTTSPVAMIPMFAQQTTAHNKHPGRSALMGAFSGAVIRTTNVETLMFARWMFARRITRASTLSSLDAA